MIKLLHNLALFWVKSVNFSHFFGKNIFKIITLVPGKPHLHVRMYTFRSEIFVFDTRVAGGDPKFQLQVCFLSYDLQDFSDIFLFWNQKNCKKLQKIAKFSEKSGSDQTKNRVFAIQNFRPGVKVFIYVFGWNQFSTEKWAVLIKTN
jgi:hypothetical protein